MLLLLRRFYREWLARGIEDDDEGPGPAEAIVLRTTGFGWLIAIVFLGFAAQPRPGFHGRGLLVLLGLVLMFGSATFARPQSPGPPGSRPITVGESRTILALSGVVVGSAVLALFQSSGI